jgi:hypothetical protein
MGDTNEEVKIEYERQIEMRNSQIADLQRQLDELIADNNRLVAQYEEAAGPVSDTTPCSFCSCAKVDAGSVRCGVLLAALKSYRCQHMRGCDGDALELVDVLSPLETIAEGMHELELLAEHLSLAIDDVEKKPLRLTISTISGTEPIGTEPIGTWRSLIVKGSEK